MFDYSSSILCSTCVLITRTRFRDRDRIYSPKMNPVIAERQMQDKLHRRKFSVNVSVEQKHFTIKSGPNKIER